MSDQPAEVVAELFVQLGVFVAQRCQLGFVPFYEPFRFQLLHESNQISPLWLPAILSFSDEYYYLDLQTQLKTVKRVELPPTSINLFMSEPAQLYQKNARHLLQLYGSWRRYCQNVGKDLDENSLIQLTNAYYDAYRNGLINIADQSLFTLMTLRYGDLSRKKVLQQAIEQAISEPGTLSKQFRLINKQIFSDLVL